MIDQAFHRLRKLLRFELRHIKRYGVSPRYDTSDVLQEACLQISREYAEDVDVDELPRSLIKKIVFGHLAKQHRFHNSEKRAQARDIAISNGVFSDDVDPQQSAEINELTGLVLKSIQRLQPIQRDIVTGRLLLDETYVTLAKRHGLTVPVVKRLFKTACAQIKVEYQNHDLHTFSQSRICV